MNSNAGGGVAVHRPSGARCFGGLEFPTLKGGATDPCASGALEADRPMVAPQRFIHQVDSRPARRSLARAVRAIAALMLLPFAAHAQYVGKVDDKPATPTLRAVGVLEWTGKAGKPKFCRLVPITIFDGNQLQDAGIYMARPAPLALQSEVEYQLKKNGRTIGLFDVASAGQQQGNWVGFGKWKAVPHPKPAFAMTAAPIDDDEDDDKPVLHRKHHDDKADGAKKTQASAGPAPDPNRPVLHKPSEQTSSDDKSAGTAPIDPDRPVLKEPKPQPKPDQNAPANGDGYVTSVAAAPDPDRPRLTPGHVNGVGTQVLPTLKGLPPDMEQTVAVSDAVNRPDHPWTYTWANPGDKEKMKGQLEDIARKALGLDQPPPAPAPKSRRASTHRKQEPAPQPLEPAPLEDEQFRVFELSYGAGATLVLTADTGGPLAQEKFVTLIAQPDLYGNVLVLLKYVTDGSHLDEKPRMRIIDAVDALADNRGELLFDLRSVSSRQFALYRVLRGSAEKLFVTSGGYFGPAGEE